MSMTGFLRRNARRLAWAGLTLECALMTFASVTYFNSTPHPDGHAQLGVVTIQLAKLDYKLTFAELQSAGMFVNVSCRKCGFSAGVKTPYMEDLEDARFMGTLFRSRQTLSLNFFGENIPAGQQQLDTALQALRAKFPGQEAAIQLVSRGFEDNRYLAEHGSP